MPVRLFWAMKSVQKAASVVNKPNGFNTAMEYLEKTIALDGLKAEYKTDYARIVSQGNESSAENIKKAEAYIKDAEKAAVSNVQVTVDVGNFKLFEGDFENGFKFIDRATKLRPYFEPQWYQRIDAYDKVAMFFLGKKNYGNYIKYSNRALEIVDEAKEVNKKNLIPFKFSKDASEILERISYTNAMSEINDATSSKRNALVFYNIADLDVNLDGMPDQWTVDEKYNVRVSNDGKVMVVENSEASNISYLKSRALNIKGESLYKVVIELEDSRDVNSISYSLISSKEKMGDLKKEGNTYSIDVFVPKLNNNETYNLILGIKDKLRIKKITVTAI
jgi:tetratricopeptide (TPR) repeat protein